MTTADLINGILEREGGFVADPSDRGGATNYGITAASWGSYRGIGRQATRSEVKAITRSEAYEFYLKQYVTGSPFAVVTYDPLRAQLVDFSVLSGTARATRWLQRVLSVPVTSAMDDRTRTALNRDRNALVNNALVAARLTMFDAIVRDDATQARFLDGWRARAISFAEFG